MSRENFWSRRKARVEAEERAEEQARLKAAEAEELAKIEEEQAEKTDAEILAELDLPDPDTIELGDDVRAFLKKAVPDRLRRRALRRLWTLDPVFACLDELVDYGEDYTDAATVVENLQTSYQVGRGMTAHIEEMARQAAAREEAEKAEALAEAEAPEEDAAEDDAATAETDIAAADPADDPDRSEPEPGPAYAYTFAEPLPDEAPAPVRRRMRFAHADE